MVFSKNPIQSNQVATHYNELDELYRKVWGEHIHHGWFQTGKETKEAAVISLSKEVLRLSEIKPNDTVCDIGCGYGATSRLIALVSSAKVLGLTISDSQFKVAQASRELFLRPGLLNFRLLDWLKNDLPENSFDHLISIESSEHMPDKNLFFTEAQRVLKPNGTFVICAWLTRQNPTAWERFSLLEPICREGRMPSMGSESDYRQLFQDNGFAVKSFQDLSNSVKRTWTLSIIGLIRHLKAHPKDIKLLLTRFNSNAEFLKTLFRIRLAYETGAMRYGIFKAVKEI